jgi:mRNA interferase MazF
VRRGDIHRLRPPRAEGREQRGVRYGVIVQADALLPRSVVLVAPTSTSARAASFRPVINVKGTTTRVLVEQVGAVDVGRLGSRSGSLTAPELDDIDAALRVVLSLD